MPATLKTGLQNTTRTSKAEDSGGAAIVVNGMGRGFRVRGDQVMDLGITAPATSLSAAGGATTLVTSFPQGTYQIYVRHLDAEGIPSSLSPVAQVIVGDTSANEYVDKLSYSAIPLGESRVSKRQIFRNTSGQVTTLYLDVEIDNNTATTASSTRGDNELAQQTALPILNANGTLNANRFDPPPTDKAVVIAHQDRYYYMADVDVDAGHVELTSGQTTCVMVGVKINSSVVGRTLDANGNSIAIASISGDDSIVLSSPWPGPSDNLVDYTIRLPDARREVIQYSAPGEPESAPGSFAFQPVDDGDRVVGAFVLNSYLYLVKRRHIYNYSTWRDPANDSGIFLRANRGALNHRCAVNVEGNVFMLDREGMFIFDGSNAQQISGPIQNFFRDGDVNFARQDEFHLSYYPEEEVVRAFVVLGDLKFPRHAFCFQYRLNAWWVEEYPFDVSSSSQVELGGRVREVAGISANRVVVISDAAVDGELSGPLRGLVTASNDRSLTLDQNPDSGVASWPISIIGGTGLGQSRKITSVSGARVEVDRPWTKRPNTTSQWQIGGVAYRVKFGWFTYDPQEGEHARRQVSISWLKTNLPALLYVGRMEDFDQTRVPEPFNIIYHDGTTVSAGDDAQAIDLSQDGWSYMRFTEKLVDRLTGGRHVMIELFGVQETEPIRLANIELNGMR